MQDIKQKYLKIFDFCFNKNRMTLKRHHKDLDDLNDIKICDSSKKGPSAKKPCGIPASCFEYQDEEFI